LSERSVLRVTSMVSATKPQIPMARPRFHDVARDPAAFRFDLDVVVRRSLAMSVSAMNDRHVVFSFRAGANVALVELPEIRVPVRPNRRRRAGQESGEKKARRKKKAKKSKPQKEGRQEENEKDGEEEKKR